MCRADSRRLLVPVVPRLRQVRLPLVPPPLLLRLPADPACDHASHSNYHWQDGIGPIENRPVRTELAWLSTESNKFGTDEFIDYARALGVEPYLCLNSASTVPDSCIFLAFH